jgi:hypothetical protein
VILLTEGAFGAGVLGGLGAGAGVAGLELGVDVAVEPGDTEEPAKYLPPLHTPIYTRRFSLNMI